MYRNCYLRFSCSEFNLTDISRHIHLTNNYVQKNYCNANRTKNLPTHNMWELSEFKEYLKSINRSKIWNTKIYPKMKESIIAIATASLEETDFIPNTFELYGCDFMIDFEYNPILIEINRSPDLSHTTDVTAKLCPAALDDLIKVVIDYTKNSKSDTGLYELIHEIDIPQIKNMKNDFLIQGNRMAINERTCLSCANNVNGGNEKKRLSSLKSMKNCININANDAIDESDNKNLKKLKKMNVIVKEPEIKTFPYTRACKSAILAAPADIDGSMANVPEIKFSENFPFNRSKTGGKKLAKQKMKNKIDSELKAKKLTDDYDSQINVINRNLDEIWGMVNQPAVSCEMWNSNSTISKLNDSDAEFRDCLENDQSFNGNILRNDVFIACPEIFRPNCLKEMKNNYDDSDEHCEAKKTNSINSFELKSNRNLAMDLNVNLRNITLSTDPAENNVNLEIKSKLLRNNLKKTSKKNKNSDEIRNKSNQNRFKHELTRNIMNNKTSKLLIMQKNLNKKMKINKILKLNQISSNLKLDLYKDAVSDDDTASMVIKTNNMNDLQIHDCRIYKNFIKLCQSKSKSKQNG